MNKGNTNKASKRKMKKGIKRLIILGAIIIAAVGGFVIYSSISSAAEAKAAFGAEPSYDAVTMGDILLTVSGSGNLGSADTLNISAESQIIAEDVLVAEGDTL